MSAAETFMLFLVGLVGVYVFAIDPFLRQRRRRGRSRAEIVAALNARDGVGSWEYSKYVDLYVDRQRQKIERVSR